MNDKAKVNLRSVLNSLLVHQFVVAGLNRLSLFGFSDSGKNMSVKTMLTSVAVFVVIREAICCQNDVRCNCNGENDCFYYPRHKMDCTE